MCLIIPGTNAPCLPLYLVNSQLATERKEVQEKVMRYEHSLRPHFLSQL